MGPGDAGAATDLDALIGDIRLEAARRRAAPDFPLDDEARLGVELDRHGPVGAGADLAAVTAALRALERHAEKPVGEVAGLAASAIAALSRRLTLLERRPPPAGATAGSQPADRPPPSDYLAPDRWADQITADMPAPGRILVAGKGAGAWVQRLNGAGRDAYGVDPGLEPYGDGDREAVRSARVLEHLQSVAAGGVALVVLVGPLAAAEAERLPELAAELGRVTTHAAVQAEAVWAWRLRVGEAAADTSPTRPVGPDAWLAALSAAGFVATGVYGPDGRDYLLSARSGG